MGIARSTISEKMILKEITVEATPITSGVVKLDKKSHKIYPATIPIVLSINRCVAFLPTGSLLIPCHHLSYLSLGIYNQPSIKS